MTMPYPPAPAAQPPAVTSAARTTIRVALVLTATLLLLGTVGGLTAAAVGIGNTRMIADSQPLPATMRTLAIDTGDLPMAVRLTTDPDVAQPRVDLRFLSAGRAGGGLDIATGTDVRVRVSGRDPGWLSWGGGVLTVVLPPDLARRLSVSTTQQDGVLMADADLDRLVAHVTDGGVLLRGSARAIEIHTQDGGIHTGTPIAVRESFAANSIDGDVTVDFDSAPRTISVRTGDGDVRLDVPGPGPFAVNAASGSGDTVVRVPQAADPAAAVAVITARTDSGDLTISRRD